MRTGQDRTLQPANQPALPPETRQRISSLVAKLATGMTLPQAAEPEVDNEAFAPQGWTPPPPVDPRVLHGRGVAMEQPAPASYGAQGMAPAQPQPNPGAVSPQVQAYGVMLSGPGAGGGARPIGPPAYPDEQVTGPNTVRYPVTEGLENDPKAMLEALLASMHPTDSQRLLTFVEGSITLAAEVYDREEMDAWGVGDRAGDPPFATTFLTDGIILGDRNAVVPLGLIVGENPHSRSANQVYARYPNGSVVDFDGKIILVSIVLEDTNYQPEESDMTGERPVRGWTRGTIYLNGYPAFEVGSEKMDGALTEASRVLRESEEIPDYVQAVAANNAISLVGRPVYYRGVPAVIANVFPSTGRIALTPEAGIMTFNLSADDLENPDNVEGMDEEERRTVVVDVLSKDIYWRRTKTYPPGYQGDMYAHLRPLPDQGVIEGRRGY